MPGGAATERTVAARRVPRRSFLFVHESAFVDEDVEIGEGTTIWHVSHILEELPHRQESCRIGQNVVIGPKCSIGNGVKIQNNVSVYEGVTLEDDVFCGPSMVFTNVYNPRSEIRRMDELRPTHAGSHGAQLSAPTAPSFAGSPSGNMRLLARAVVTKNVPDFALVVGNPESSAGCASVGTVSILRQTQARAWIAEGLTAKQEMR